MDIKMKKVYLAPEAEIEAFTIDDIIVTSTQDDAEGHIDAVIEDPDAIVQDVDTGEVKAYMDEHGESYSPDEGGSTY